MSELIVIGFKKDMYRASEALNQIKDLNKTWDLDLNDAVAVYRDYDGKLRVDQSYQMTTGEGAAWGGLFGGLLGALVAAPFTGGASLAGATAAAVIGAGSLGGVALGASLGAIDAGTWKEDFGVSEDFVQRMGAMLQPRDSAVFVLARTVNPDRVAEAFRGYGGTVLRTSLSAKQRARVEETLHATR
ncbi:MAG TPA: DUF1269 domain-containing protein [Thermoanaerobaculia bacterium]